MGNGAVKTIVLLMVLVVLSFVVGAQVSENLAKSTGAFVVIGGVVVVFLFVFMGNNIWKLLYYFPVMALGRSSVSVSSVPYSYMCCAAVLIYGVVAWSMGYVRFRWRSVFILDALVLLVLGVMVASFIRYPVDGIGGISMDAEYVGGREYVWCLAAAIYYLAISSMSASAGEIEDTVKKSFYVFIVAQIAYIVLGLRSTGAEATVADAYSKDVRFSYLMPLGAAMVYFIYTKYTMMAIATSLRRMLVALTGLGLVVVAGNREPAVGLAEIIAVLAFLKREFIGILFACVAMYGALFVVSNEHVLIGAPVAVQRVLVIVPGLELNSHIRQGTEGSSDTRRHIWKLALDPHSGFIKDYVWGDGYQTSTQMLARRRTADMRRVAMDALELRLARSANWHNGALTTINRIGIVGLIVLSLVFIYGLVLLLQIWRAYEHSPLRPYLMTMCLPFAYTAFTYGWGTQTVLNFFIVWQYLGVIKLLYCATRERGLLRPLFHREQYIPMTIRELEKTA